MFRFCWTDDAVNYEFTSNLDLGEMFYRILSNVPVLRRGTTCYLLSVWSVRETWWVLFATYGFVTNHFPFISIQKLFESRRLIADYAYAHGSQ